jgi:hypothetical protein
MTFLDTKSPLLGWWLLIVIVCASVAFLSLCVGVVVDAARSKVGRPATYNNGWLDAAVVLMFLPFLPALAVIWALYTASKALLVKRYRSLDARSGDES